MPNIGLHITQLSDIVQKRFCTSDGAMDLTFHMNYVPAVYHVCSRRNAAKTVAQIKGVFFVSPFNDSKRNILFPMLAIYISVFSRSH